MHKTIAERKAVKNLSEVKSLRNECAVALKEWRKAVKAFEHHTDHHTFSDAVEAMKKYLKINDKLIDLEIRKI